MSRYRDRAEAARALGDALQRRAGSPDLLVLAIPRGGVPVACDVAYTLGAPLDLLIVRKVYAPHRLDLELGAVTSGGIRIVDQDVASEVPEELVTWAMDREEEELRRRERALRGHSRPPMSPRDRTVILVDDGLATGSTMKAAVQAARRLRASAVLVAVPGGSERAVDELRAEADEIICPRRVSRIFDVRQLYEELSPIADAEVRGLLEYAWRTAEGHRLHP